MVDKRKSGVDCEKDHQELKVKGFGDLGGALPGPAVCHRCKARAAQMVRSGETGRETSLQAFKYIFLRELMLITGEEKSAFPKFFLPVPCSW